MAVPITLLTSVFGALRYDYALHQPALAVIAYPQSPDGVRLSAHRVFLITQKYSISPRLWAIREEFEYISGTWPFAEQWSYVQRADRLLLQTKKKKTFTILNGALHCRVCNLESCMIKGELVLHLLEVEDWRQKSDSERSKKGARKPKLLLNTGSDFCQTFLNFKSVRRRPAKSKLRGPFSPANTANFLLNVCSVCSTERLFAANVRWTEANDKSECLL